MPLNSPGGSTLQWGWGEIFICLTLVILLMCVGKESHSGGIENMLSATSLAETHISPDDIPYTDQYDNGALR